MPDEDNIAVILCDLILLFFIICWGIYVIGVYQALFSKALYITKGDNNIAMLYRDTILGSILTLNQLSGATMGRKDT